MLDDDTEETLHERIKEVERRLYPDVIERLVQNDRAGSTTVNTKIQRALLSVWDKTGLVDLARALHELGVELVSSGGTATALADAGHPGHDASKTSPASPEMLDHRVETLHPKIHGGLLADRGKESHRADLEPHGIQPFDLVVSNLYPFLDRPDIETIDIGGPAMTRAAAKNHAWVTIVTSPDQYGPLLDELRANDGDGERRDAPRVRARGVRAHRRVRRRDRAVARRTASCCPRTSCSRSTAPTRRCATARTRTSPARATAGTARRAGGTACSSTAGSRSRTSTTTTPTPRGSSCTTSATAPRAPSSSTRTRAACASTTTSPTAYQRALECDERSAFGGIVALNRPIDAATVERMVAGPQADLVIAPGYEPGAIEALQKRRKNTRILEAPAPGRRDARRPPDLRRLPASRRRTTSRRRATTGASSPRSRPRPSSGATSSSRGASAAT